MERPEINGLRPRAARGHRAVFLAGRRHRLLAPGVAVLATIAALLIGCSGQEQASGSSPEIATTVVVPDVTGKRFTPPAIRKLCAAGLTIGRVRVAGNEPPAASLGPAISRSRVVATHPSHGARVSRGAAVDLDIAGPRNAGSITAGCDLRRG